MADGPEVGFPALSRWQRSGENSSSHGWRCHRAEVLLRKDRTGQVKDIEQSRASHDKGVLAAFKAEHVIARYCTSRTAYLIMGY